MNQPVDLINPFKARGEVYGLVDVRNPDEVQYVGSSITGARARVRQHLNGSSGGGRVREWVYGMGTNLRYVILEEDVPERWLLAREKRWILKLRPPLNTIHMKRSRWRFEERRKAALMQNERFASR